MNTRLLTILLLALAGCGGQAPPPAHADEEEHEAHVAMTDAQISTAGISLETAGPASIRETLPLYGSIVANAERVRDVAARFPGVVRTVVHQVGDDVRAGETLATIESNESLQVYAVIAPLSGVITARSVNPGEQSGERPLFTVADLSSVWVEMSLFPRDVAKVKRGQSVQVNGGEGGLEGEGRVTYVAPFSNTSNQTLIARVALDNATRRWAPGLYVTAHVTLGETPVPLAVAASALQTLEQPTVFVRSAAGFEPRTVRTGRTDGRYVEILAGLAPGDVYAANNSFIVKAELGKGSAAHAD